MVRKLTFYNQSNTFSEIKRVFLFAEMGAVWEPQEEFPEGGHGLKAKLRSENSPNREMPSHTAGVLTSIGLP